MYLTFTRFLHVFQVQQVKLWRWSWTKQDQVPASLCHVTCPRRRTSRSECNFTGIGIKIYSSFMKCRIESCGSRRVLDFSQRSTFMSLKRVYVNVYVCSPALLFTNWFLCFFFKCNWCDWSVRRGWSPSQWIFTDTSTAWWTTQGGVSLSADVDVEVKVEVLLMLLLVFHAELLSLLQTRLTNPPTTPQPRSSGTCSTWTSSATSWLLK